MARRVRTIAIAVATGVVVTGAGVAVGRASIDTRSVRDAGYRSGTDDGYFKGLLVGEVQGRQEGRALQSGAELPAADRHVARDAFDAGYLAGGNDVFAGYDGGWATTAPYVVTVVPGRDRDTYRIGSREPMVAGVSYYLCPNGRGLCQQPRH